MVSFRDSNMLLCFFAFLFIFRKVWYVKKLWNFPTSYEIVMVVFGMRLPLNQKAFPVFFPKKKL